MKENELAKIVEESIKDKVLLMNDEIMPNIVYTLDGKPCIPVFEKTNEGLRKKFSIIIQED